MLDTYSGATRVVFVVGHPIAQVKAPQGITKLCSENGRDAIVVPIDVEPDDLDAFVASTGRLRNVDGICVTVPHKFAMTRHCTTLSPTSRLLAATNMLRRNSDHTWHGDMLDGAAQVAAFRAKGAALEDSVALLVGAGGAGGAIGLALLDAGVRALAVHDKDMGRRDALIGKLDAAHPGKVRVGSADPSSFDLVANATPSGMDGFDSFPIDVDRLRPGTFVGDVVTRPEITPLIDAALARGCLTSTGLDMFEAGKRLQYSFWFGETPIGSPTTLAA